MLLQSQSHSGRQRRRGQHVGQRAGWRRRLGGRELLRVGGDVAKVQDGGRITAAADDVVRESALWQEEHPAPAGGGGGASIPGAVPGEQYAPRRNPRNSTQHNLGTQQ